MATITIEFPHSTAGSFAFALAAARTTSTFEQVGDGKEALYRVTYASEDLGDALPLVEQLKGWRRRAVYLDGQQLPWDAVFGFLWCYNQRLSSYEPERYCFGAEGEWQANLWGCIQAEMPFRAGCLADLGSLAH